VRFGFATIPAQPFEALCDLLIAEDGGVSQIVHDVTGDAAHERGEVPELDYAEQRAALKTQARGLLQIERVGD